MALLFFLELNGRQEGFARVCGTQLDFGHLSPGSWISFLVFLSMSGPPLSSLELRRDEAAGCLLYRSMGSPLSEKEAHDIQGPEVKNKPYKRWSEWECDVILTKPTQS